MASSLEGYIVNRLNKLEIENEMLTQNNKRLVKEIIDHNKFVEKLKKVLGIKLERDNENDIILRSHNLHSYYSDEKVDLNEAIEMLQLEIPPVKEEEKNEQ